MNIKSMSKTIISMVVAIATVIACTGSAVALGDHDRANSHQGTSAVFATEEK